MKRFLRAIACLPVILYATDSLAAQSTDTLMLCEADVFISNLPAGLQQFQKQAIEKAIKGDASTLNEVRNSRNIPSALSPGVHAVYLTPTMCLYEKEHDSNTLPLLIYLHGGGWTFGSINSCSRFCNAVAASGKARVLAVDYRLAPEHPFPAALDDCSAALDFVEANYTRLRTQPEYVSIGGDSAGGNLALATALRNNHTRVRSLVLFYPVIKAFADDSPSWNTYRTGYGLDADLMQTFNDAYTLGADPCDKYISFDSTDGDNFDLPPTLLINAGRDILCDQGKEFADRFPDKVRRIVFPHAVHLFITVPGQPAAFEKAVELTVGFLSATNAAVESVQ